MLEQRHRGSDGKDPPESGNLSFMSSTPPRQLTLDVLIIGGGVAGLWTLDTLSAAGHDVGLVEATAFGDGQTICAQGILHGGVKYSLNGLLDPGSRQISSMPARWAESIDGDVRPALGEVRVRTRACHLWRTDSMKSIISMAGAKLALQVKPTTLAREERPAILAGCPGDVALLPELVLETPTLLEALAARHRDRILKATVVGGDAGPGATEEKRIDVEIDGGRSLQIRAKHVVITAGAGARQLLDLLEVGRDTGQPEMQKRPLHMAMVKGPPDRLPELNGHCVDGAATRVTVTSSTASDGARVWQLGGELSETGCQRSCEEQIRAARACLADVIPGFEADDPALLWATYRVDRAEAAQGSGRNGRRARRPDDTTVISADGVTVAWPTKMVLAPRCADLIAEQLDPGAGTGTRPFAGLPVPEVATPPWETATWS